MLKYSSLLISYCRECRFELELWGSSWGPFAAGVAESGAAVGIGSGERRGVLVHVVV